MTCHVIKKWGHRLFLYGDMSLKFAHLSFGLLYGICGKQIYITLPKGAVICFFKSMIWPEKRVICAFTDANHLPFLESDLPCNSYHANLFSHHWIFILMSYISLHITGFSFRLSLFAVISLELAFAHGVFAPCHRNVDLLMHFLPNIVGFHFRSAVFLSSIAGFCQALAKICLTLLDFLFCKAYFGSA